MITSSIVKNIFLNITLFVLLLLASCSSAETQHRSVIIKGEITVSAEADTTRDFSGINLSIISTREGVRQDTILNAFTDYDGRFNVVATIEERGTYPLVVSRNNRVVHITNIVLAPSDTITITGQLPDIARNFRINSFENSAMETYERLQRLYGRVATFAYGGRVEADTIPSLMGQWSDYFWSLRDEYPGSYASELGSIDAIEILEGWNDTLVMERIEQLESLPSYLPVKIIYGGHIKARLDGLDAGLNYLDRLRSSIQDAEQRVTIDMRKIELLVDYEEYDRALSELEPLSRRNRNDQTFIEWAASVRYELENLIPGRMAPDFEIRLNDKETIDRASLMGYYYMIEVVFLADQNYQAVYPELINLHSTLPQDKVRFYSLPLDNSQVTINAFFEERPKRWTFSDARVLDTSNYLEAFRIDQVPTRYLIGPDGVIISRYVAHTINGLRQDFENILQQLN